jgi:hypothetical protein
MCLRCCRPVAAATATAGAAVEAASSNCMPAAPCAAYASFLGRPGLLCGVVAGERGLPSAGPGDLVARLLLGAGDLAVALLPLAGEAVLGVRAVVSGVDAPASAVRVARGVCRVQQVRWRWF